MAAWQKLELDRERAQVEAMQERRRVTELEAELQEMRRRLGQQEAGVGRVAGFEEASSSSVGAKGAAKGSGKPSAGPSGAPAAGAEPLYVGTVTALGSGAAEIGCHEAGTIFGVSMLDLAVEHLPPGTQTGAMVCFALRRPTTDEQGALEVVPGSVVTVEAAGEIRHFVGTVKAFSKRQTGERVGWLFCMASQQLYASDVYVHGSMIEGLNVGDAVSFQVYVNQKGQPQANHGSVRLLGAAPTNGCRTAQNGMDATLFAPGRLVAIQQSHADAAPFESGLEAPFAVASDRGQVGAAQRPAREGFGVADDIFGDLEQTFRAALQRYGIEEDDERSEAGDVIASY